jgi:hypothetical protein
MFREMIIRLKVSLSLPNPHPHHSTSEFSFLSLNQNFGILENDRYWIEEILSVIYV